MVNRGVAASVATGWIDDNPDAIAQQELDAWLASGTVDYAGRLQDDAR